ncbi:MAG: hypothetical protein MUC38_00630 [Cyclobacteriaceae bacterium]|nr:hypothetical protein [Cyclobacteriaceae bacterium]
MRYSSLAEFFVRLHTLALRYALLLALLVGSSVALPLFWPRYFYRIPPLSEIEAAAFTVALILAGFVGHTWWLRQSRPVFGATASLGDRLEHYRKTVGRQLSLVLWVSLPGLLLNLFFLFQWIAITFVLPVFLLAIYWPSRHRAVAWLQLKGAEREMVLKG